ncbi:MAG: DegV family protein [Clostridiales bacterium]|nr:DegV family protein [Clostridiales bacterium]
MIKYRIYVDAAADIPETERKRYKIGILPIPVAMGDKTYQSGTELSNEEFYSLMEAYDGIPVTSQITPFAFEELFKAELEQRTEHLILVLINAKGSATYNNAIAVRDQFMEENQDASKMQIHVFDGTSYSGGYGYAAILAAQKLEMGMKVEEVLPIIEQQLGKQRIYFGLYTLKYAGKSGRIPSAAVFVGEALGIKPIMRISDHKITTVGKARGEKKLVKEIGKMVMGDIESRTPYSLVYGNDDAARQEMYDEMVRRLGYPPVYQFQIGAAVAINAGPRIVGVIFEVRKKERDKNS